jgi:vacuolar-type H+-ATPase subunit H
MKPYLPFLTSLAYYTIYVYSFCQIVFSKTINFCVPYINLAVKRIFNAISKPSIELKPDVKEPQPTTSIKIDTDDDNLVLIKSPTNDVIILDTVPDTLDNLKYEVSNVRFLAIYLKLTVSNSHIIELFNNDANYYVVGNKLDSKFFKYYLHNVLNIKVDNESPFEYKLEIMDHNVNMIYVNEKQNILIEKDGYEISLLSEANSEAKSEAKEEESEEEEEAKEEAKSEPKEEFSEAKEEAKSEAKSVEFSEAKNDALEVETKETKSEAKEAKSEEFSEANENGLDASTIYY